jgi:hypothetical protein
MIWRTLQGRVYEFFREFGADKSVNEESRVMRLTPFPNQKEGRSVETESYIRTSLKLNGRQKNFSHYSVGTKQLLSQISRTNHPVR